MECMASNPIGLISPACILSLGFLFCKKRVPGPVPEEQRLGQSKWEPAELQVVAASYPPTCPFQCQCPQTYILVSAILSSSVWGKVGTGSRT